MLIRFRPETQVRDNREARRAANKETEYTLQKPGKPIGARFHCHNHSLWSGSGVVKLVSIGARVW